MITVGSRSLIFVEAKIVRRQFESTEQLGRYVPILGARKEPERFLILRGGKVLLQE
jgi:hypothetical protein